MKPQISIRGVKIPTAMMKDSPAVKASRGKKLSLPCKDCDFKAPDVQHMKVHRKTAHQQKKIRLEVIPTPQEINVKFHCIFCQVGFEHEPQLTMHEHEKHKELVNPTLDQHACTMCNVIEKTSLSLEAHMLNNHSPDFSSQCNFCDKRFAYENNLQIQIACDHPKETN